MKLSRRILSLIAASGLVLTSLVAAVVMFVQNTNRAHAASAFPSEYFAPYDDVTIGASLQSVTQTTGQKYYTLAFITGNGCNAAWAGTILLNQTSTYLPNLDSDISYIRSQGGDVIFSFGGEAGQELAQTCSSVSSLQAQYQAVHWSGYPSHDTPLVYIVRYDSVGSGAASRGACHIQNTSVVPCGFLAVVALRFLLRFSLNMKSSRVT